MALSEAPAALVVFDLALGAALALDYALFTRRSARVVSRTGPALAALLVVLYAVLAEPHPWLGRAEGAAAAALTAAFALFGYANAAAFLKRGITFAILLNRARPAGERAEETGFIDLGMRVGELRANGWAVEEAGRWRLTERGRLAGRLRRLALRLLGAEAVG